MAQIPPPKVLLALETAAYAFAAWRLFARQLVGRQKALMLFLLFRCLLTALLTGLPANSHLYFWFYVCLTPLDGLVSILAVSEAIGLVFQDYPGLTTTVRWTTYLALAIALALTVMTGAAFWRADQVTSNLYYSEVLNRSVVFGLGVMVTLLLIFLSRYNIQMDRNRIVSSVAFGILVFSEAIGLYMDSMAEHLNVPAVDLAVVAVGTVCVFMWGLLLQPHEQVVRTQKKDLSESDRRLLHQLDLMERAVSGLGRGRLLR